MAAPIATGGAPAAATKVFMEVGGKGVDETLYRSTEGESKPEFSLF